MLVKGNEIVNVEELEVGQTYYLRDTGDVRVINHRDRHQPTERPLVEAVTTRQNGDSYIARIRVFRDRSGRRRAQVVRMLN